MTDFINWVLAHSAVLTGFGVALLDLIFAINPNAESNGILHWLAVQLGIVKVA